MNFNHSLVSDLTFSLAPSEEAYIKIEGNLSTCLLGIKIEAGASYVVQSSLVSTEAFKLYSNHSDAEWEDISIDGIPYASLTFDIPSVLFKSPNVLYISNTSATENIKVSLRGNRS